MLLKQQKLLVGQKSGTGAAIHLCINFRHLWVWRLLFAFSAFLFLLSFPINLFYEYSQQLLVAHQPFLTLITNSWTLKINIEALIKTHKERKTRASFAMPYLLIEPTNTITIPSMAVEKINLWSGRDSLFV